MWNKLSAVSTFLLLSPASIAQCFTTVKSLSGTPGIKITKWYKRRRPSAILKLSVEKKEFGNHYVGATIIRRHITKIWSDK
jgi:hypothetical protein